MKVEKESPVHYCEFCVIFKNDYLAEHVQTVASDTWDIPTWGISCKVHIVEMHSFLQHFGTHSFQTNFRVLHNLSGVFRTISNIYDEAFWQKYLTAFAEMLRQRYLIGFCLRLCIGCFFIFFHFLRLDTWMNDMNILLLFRKCAAICSHDVNQKYYKTFYWFPNHVLYIDHGNTNLLYSYTVEM